MSTFACPSRTWITLISVFCSSRCVAKLCRSGLLSLAPCGRPGPRCSSPLPAPGWPSPPFFFARHKAIIRWNICRTQDAPHRARSARPYTFGSFISRVSAGAPRRLNQTAPDIVIISPGAFIASVSPGFRCWSEAAAKWPDECGAQQAKGFTGASARPSECRRLWFLSFVCRTEHFARNYQGVSHAKWPKAKHECAATQTGSVICWTLEAMDVERHPRRAHRPSKRAKKLRAVSGARPH